MTRRVENDLNRHLAAQPVTRLRRHDLPACSRPGLAGSASTSSRTPSVGIAPTESLASRLPRTRVVPVRTTQDLKEQAYSRLQLLLSERSIVLPDHAELRKQLGGIVARPTPLGGLKIEARHESVHDDLADALAFAVLGLPEPGKLADPPGREFPAGQQWTQTQAGIRIPLPAATVRAEASYAGLYGGYVTCPGCGLPYPPYRATCPTPGCGKDNPERPASAPAPAASPAPANSGGEAAPAPNYWNPHLMRCPAGHHFDTRYSEQCPQCSGRPGASRVSGPTSFGGLPPGLAGRLGGILGPVR